MALSPSPALPCPIRYPMGLAWPEPRGWLSASLPSWPRAVPAIFKPSGEGTDTNPTTAPTQPPIAPHAQRLPHSLQQQPPRSAGTRWDPQAGVKPPDKWHRLLGSALPSHQGCPKGTWGQQGAGRPLPASSREAPRGGSGGSRGGRRGAAAHPLPALVTAAAKQLVATSCAVGVCPSPWQPIYFILASCRRSVPPPKSILPVPPPRPQR